MDVILPASTPQSYVETESTMSIAASEQICVHLKVSALTPRSMLVPDCVIIGDTSLVDMFAQNEVILTFRIFCELPAQPLTLTSRCVQ